MAPDGGSGQPQVSREKVPGVRRPPDILPRVQLGDGNVESIALVPAFGLVLVAGLNHLHVFYLDREANYWERLSTGGASLWSVE